MKTIKLIILSLLLVASQAFAWGQAEQKALLGFTVGVALTHFISKYDTHSYQTQRYEQNFYTPEPSRAEYIDARNSSRNDTVEVNNYYYNTNYYNERPRHHRSKKVVVQNYYSDNYYY